MAMTIREWTEAHYMFQSQIEPVVVRIVEEVKRDLVWIMDEQRWDGKKSVPHVRRLIREATGYPFSENWRGRFILASRFGMMTHEMYPDLVALTDHHLSNTQALERVIDRASKADIEPNLSPTTFERLLLKAIGNARFSAIRPVWNPDEYSDSETSSPLAFY